MTPERWQKLKQIFDSALRRAPEERSEFLASACGDDELLRREVESLIASKEKVGSFMDAPAYQAAAELFVEDKVDLRAGETVGSYEILSFLGRGGMGEVYLGRDRRLGRKVALKFLPPSFGDPDSLQRFEQEARAASALNHPNIITIYEITKVDSKHLIAAEFIEGKTLRERLAHDPLTLDEALHVAVQISDALTAAHKAGIIHRDIKPENVMLRPDGYVKVLDFGLAKLAETASPLSAAEIPTKRLKTASGMIIGTVDYMSPEQARGLAVDARTDIFSLGAVIYEMVARRRPFAAETMSDVLAAILNTEPPSLSLWAPEAPAELVRIVSKALRKDREERYQVIKDLFLDLKGLAQDLEFQRRLKHASTPEHGKASARPVGSEDSIGARTADSRHQTANITEAKPMASIKSAVSSIINAKRWPIFALVGLIVASGLFFFYRSLNRSRNATTVVPIIENVSRITTWSGLDTQPTLSPDGNSVAYTSNHNGSFEIYIKQLTTGGREIQLTSDGQENFQPAWSPDGQQIAYFSKRRGGIWVVPVLGGAPKQLIEFGSAPAWSRDGAKLAFQSDSDPDLGASSIGSSTIWIAPAKGGTPQQITKVGNPTGAHLHPTWSPDGQRLAFATNYFTSGELWSVSVAGGEPNRLTHRPTANVGQSPNWRNPVGGRARCPVYSHDGGEIYFVAESKVWMLPISPVNDEPVADPVTITDTGASFIASMSLSADGRKIAYNVQSLASNIWSVSTLPNTYEASGTPKYLTNQTNTRNTQPAFSPDGQRFAFLAYLRGGTPSLWLADADGKNPVQISERVNLPSWFPDGDQIAFTSNREKHWSVWAISLQSRRERLIFDIGRDIQYARLSPDGKQIVFNIADNGIINSWIVLVSGGQPKQLTFDQELAGFACWSPDGKFLAFQIKRGDDAYVMVMPSDGGGDATQLTFGQGRSWPHSFSRDGDKVLFAGEREGIWNVYWVSRSTKQQKQLTNHTKLNAYVRYPAWSPLGNQIAYEYAETTGNVWSLELK
jgi:Tol biopolymer transport system component